ncbi:hypothetical protein VPH35_120040 [Triticum aestivum]
MLENTGKGVRVLSLCEGHYDTVLGVLNICNAMIRDYQCNEGGLQSKELVSCVDMAYDCVDECGYELIDMPAVGTLVDENNELGMLVKLNTPLVASQVMFLE